MDIQNIWLNYNATTDTMYVGIQGYKNVAGKEEIFGDDTGNPNPAQDPNPNFGGLKSVALAFAPTALNAAGQEVAGTPSIIAGIPQDKSQGGSGTIDGFTVSQYSRQWRRAAVQLRPAVAQLGEPGLQSLGGATRLGIHHQQFQQDLRRESHERVLPGGVFRHAGECRWETRDVFSLRPPAEPQTLSPEPTTWMVWAAPGGRSRLAVSPPAGGCAPDLESLGIGSAL